MPQALCHKYSDEIRDKKVLLIGPYPPPLGGVSIHIKRVIHKLRQQNNDVQLYNTATKYGSKFSSFTNFVKKLWSVRPDIVLYHEPTESVQKLAIALLCKHVLRYTLVTIDHDCRILYNFSKLKKRLFASCIARVDKAVVIGNTTNQCYLDNAILISRLKSYAVESPFLPPNLCDEEEILSQYPQPVHEFIATHTPLITANAFAPILVDGKDLYGFDLCIELIDNLRKTHPTVGLLFGVCKIETNTNKSYFDQIQQTIKERGLQTHFYFSTNEPEFWPIIKQSDLFVRPTRSDSFGISVQEAIELGTPAIASDVCVRPTGTILFETGNFLTTVFDFFKKNLFFKTARPEEPIGRLEGSPVRGTAKCKRR